MSNQGTKRNIIFLFIHPWQQFAITQPTSTLAGSLVARRMNTKWMEKQCGMVVETLWILVSREYLLLSCSRQCRFQNRLHLMSCTWCIWVSCEIYALFSTEHFLKPHILCISTSMMGGCQRRIGNNWELIWQGLGHRGRYPRNIAKYIKGFKAEELQNFCSITSSLYPSNGSA